MKYKRQAKIIELIKDYKIETQEELVKLLQDSGYKVTQATISRDIKELRLIKVLDSNGVYKYATINEQKSSTNERFKKVFKDTVVSIDSAQQIIVIKTIIGAANVVAAALDALDIQEVVGTIAGDDTIFLLVKHEMYIEDNISYLNSLLQ